MIGRSVKTSIEMVICVTYEGEICNYAKDFIGNSNIVPSDFPKTADVSKQCRVDTDLTLKRARSFVLLYADVLFVPLNTFHSYINRRQVTGLGRSRWCWSGGVWSWSVLTEEGKEYKATMHIWSNTSWQEKHDCASFRLTG